MFHPRHNQGPTPGQGHQWLTARSCWQCPQCQQWHSEGCLAHWWWNCTSPHIHVCAPQLLSPQWSYQVLVQWQIQAWHHISCQQRRQDIDLCGQGHTQGGTSDTNNTTYAHLPCQILAHMDAMEPWTPPPPPTNFYHFAMGLWVKFTGPIDSRRLKRHGYITVVEDGLVTVVDKHTFAEVSNKLSSAELANIRPKFDINRAELEVTASQGPSILARDKVHPLVGQWVINTVGPHRTYKGVVQEIGNTSATVELQAFFTSSILPCQSFLLMLLKPMYVHYLLVSMLLIFFL